MRQSQIIRHCALFALLLMLLFSGPASGDEPLYSWPTANGDKVALDYIYKPISSGRPRPAVVLMHGCGGSQGGEVNNRRFR